MQQIKASRWYNLLDVEMELQLAHNPKLFWQEIQDIPPKSTIIIDEIQKLPLLLNYIQMGIDQLHHRFIMSGSSARKLKRGSANLLGGRALDLRLHPLTHQEIGKNFSIEFALQYGTLPKIMSLVFETSESKENDGDKIQEIKDSLHSYFTTYLKEEIQAEALTRSLIGFQRFLPIAAQANGDIIEYANISSRCSVPMSTVKEYFSILEDTLIGHLLWPHDRSERKKARPKFYLFDCGVARAIQNRLSDPPTPPEMGHLFEAWFYHELKAMRDYQKKDHEFSLWRQGPHEIDFLVTGGRGPLLGIECKSGNTDPHVPSLKAFKNAFPKVPLLIASKNETRSRKLSDDVSIVPWKEALARYEEF